MESPTYCPIGTLSRRRTESMSLRPTPTVSISLDGMNSVTKSDSRVPYSFTLMAPSRCVSERGVILLFISGEHTTVNVESTTILASVSRMDVPTLFSSQAVATISTANVATTQFMSLSISDCRFYNVL